MSFSITTIHNIQTLSPVPLTDWFLPSKDELNAMYTELHLYGLASFLNAHYWSSSEIDTTHAFDQLFTDGNQGYNNLKTLSTYVRPCRLFTTTSLSYSLRGIGPAGGRIFYALDNMNGTTTYMEAAVSDITTPTISVWSNVGATYLHTTGTDIGDGPANTYNIVGQIGHTNSAAKICNDLIV